jgi:hypothetical protein
VWALLCATSHAATFTVTNTLDSGAGSLRAAIANVNASAGPHVIDFAFSTAPWRVQNPESSGRLDAILVL